MSDTSPPLEAATASPGKPNLAQLAIGMLCLLTAIGGVLLLAFLDMPTEKAVMVGGFVGAAVDRAGSVVGYYFGSSAGSAAKDIQVGRLTGFLR